MLERIFSELGPWNWMVLGFALLALEILVPGVFLLWIGIAALVTGALSLALWEARFWTWEVQVLVFLVLSLISAYTGKRIVGSSKDTTDQPLLNRRGEQLVGQVFLLDQAIVDGRGRLKIGDAFWVAEGPELPQGARVRVVSAHNMSLQVRPLD